MKIRSAGTSSTFLQGQGFGGPVGQVQSHPLAALLFGKRPPKLVDRRKHPKLKKSLSQLEDLSEHVALLLGRSSEREFNLELCEGDNACISRDGQIAFGVEFLEEHQDDHDLLLGVLAHEIGHQPWSWPGGDLSALSRAQLDQLYRDEEAKADRFAGRALAELGGRPDSLERFLSAHAAGFEEGQSNQYYPAAVRIEQIRGAFERRARAKSRSPRLLGG